MKKFIYVSLFIILGLFLVGCSTDTPVFEQNATNSESLPTFTLVELSEYTGLNGSTAYIAVEGVVYDVTNAFDNGKHQGIQIGGTDATAIFSASPHSTSLLATLRIVGTIDNNPTSTTDNTNNTNTTTEQSTNTTTNQTTSTETIYLPVFTLNELSSYTGANGSTAYIAVNGVVYDVTNEFTNGQHQGIQIGGTDATSIFASSPHSAALLSTLQIVGSLEGYEQVSTDSVTTPSTSNTTNGDYDDDYDNDYDDDDDYDNDYDDDDDYDDDYDDDEYDD